MGRDERHFLTEASKVIPEVEDKDIRDIRERYLNFLEKKRMRFSAGGTAL